MNSTALAFGAALAAVSAPLSAQTDGADGATLPQRFGDLARERLNRPDLGQRVLEQQRAGREARILGGLQLDLRARESDADGELGLGLGFRFVKTVARPEVEQDAALEFVGWGDVGFDADANHDDFLTFALRARWFGTTSFGDGASRATLTEELSNPDTELIAGFDRERFAELATRYAQLPTQSAVRADPAFQALAQPYLASVERALPNELVYDLDLHLGLEANQRFTARQPVFGLGFASRLVSWDPDAALSRANLFDLPGATLRWLTDSDERFRMSGQAWPTVLLGLDVVDAGEDPARSALVEDDAYLRGKIELGQRSELFEVDGRRLGLTLAWRYHEEIDAPAAVRRADIESSDHFSARIELPHGLYVEYTAGRLPLDAQDDSGFAVGYALSF